jgi:asparagine synthase (glutamine-hydrolysing)
MCGIAGILKAEGSEPAVLLSQLETLVGALKHRGPDDHGIWTSPNGTAGLSHVRLSILDLSSAGHQPMHTPDNLLHITFNGEIYNFRELRAELERDGVSFRTHTDTEVLLRLYERDGTAMLARLRGMFAFAIWDERLQRCFLARDPLGIKPLYYTLRGGFLAFASEVRALQTAGLAGRDLDADALVRYFLMGSVQEPQTLLTDVHCLDAGHYLLWERGRLAKRCYWRVAFHPENIEPAQAAVDVRAALIDSVRAHFVSDVPVGIFLSGGIDSTALVALAKFTGHENIATFSIGVDDKALDESGVARRTAEHFGTRHSSLSLDADLGQQLFTGFLRSMDQPTIDGLNTYAVSSFARENGMKVVLSGLGGDEIFAGYRSFDTVPRLQALARTVRWIPLAGELAGWALERNPHSAKLRRIGGMLRSDATIAGAYRCFRGIFSLRAARMLAAHYLRCSPKDLPYPACPEVFSADPRDAVSECEIALYMRNQLLRDSDVMSMAHGLELRVPMVDRALFDRLARVPARQRLRSGKQMLLDAVPEIPEWVKNQKKRGFVFPFEKWLDQKWGGAFAEATHKMPFSHPTWFMRWAVFVLDRWIERIG